MPSYTQYMRQMAVLDADEDIKWITVKGNPVPIKKGQNKGDAVKEFFEKKNGGSAKKTEPKKLEKPAKKEAPKPAKKEEPKKAESAPAKIRGWKYENLNGRAHYSKMYGDKEVTFFESSNEEGWKTNAGLVDTFKTPQEAVSAVENYLIGNMIDKNVKNKDQRKTLKDMMKSAIESKHNPNITVEQVYADAIAGGKYSEKDIKARIALFDEVTAKGLRKAPDGKVHSYDTLWRHTTGGKWVDGELVDYTWKPERLEIQKAILKQDKKGWKNKLPEKGQKPKLIILGGRGGSGKSLFTKKDKETGKLVLGDDGYDKDKYLVVDPDSYKERLPEYKSLVDKKDPRAGLNAWEVHEESSFMKKAMLKWAKDKGINIVLDGTLANYGSTAKTIAEFKKAGYDVEGAYMRLPREKSAVRGVNRGMNIAEGGRWVPSELMLAMTDNEENFIKMIPEFTKWSIYDNDVPLGTRAKMIAKS